MLLLVKLVLAEAALVACLLSVLVPLLRRAPCPKD